MKRRFSGSVLIVDDEDGIRTLLSWILRQLGLQVSEAPDGLSALKQLNEKPVDVVITDLEMRGLRGDALIAAARQLGTLSATKFVIMSGGILSNNPDADEEKIAALADGRLGKPFEPEQICSLLESVNPKLRIR